MKKLISLLALSASMTAIAAEPADLSNDGGMLAQQAAILNQLQPVHGDIRHLEINLFRKISF